jgi:hypothetical protein
LQVVAIGPLTYVLSLLPISVSGLGLREVSMSAMYISLGANIEQALTLVAITRFILMLETLPGALWVSQMLTQAKTINLHTNTTPNSSATQVGEIR